MSFWELTSCWRSEISAASSAGAREGEVRLNEDDASRSRLRNLLGIGEGITTPTDGQAQRNAPVRAKGRCAPRNPKRDKIGLPEPAYA